MGHLKAHIQNMLNVSYVGAVWVDVVNDAVAVVAGVMDVPLTLAE